MSFALKIRALHLHLFYKNHGSPPPKKNGGADWMGAPSQISSDTCIRYQSTFKLCAKADVAVTRRNQWLGVIRITFTCTTFKSCFQKSSVMQYTPSFQHTLVWNACVLAEKQLCWFQYSAGKKYHDFILSLIAFPYSNICYCPWFKLGGLIWTSVRGFWFTKLLTHKSLFVQGSKLTAWQLWQQILKSVTQSKNAVCALIKHSRYFHYTYNFTSIQSHAKKLY